MKIYYLEPIYGHDIIEESQQINIVYGVDAEAVRGLEKDIALARGNSLISEHLPLKVSSTDAHHTKPIADISFLGISNVIIMSEKAVEILGDMLEGKGELLGLNSIGLEMDYYVFHMQRYIDALDKDKCWGLTLKKTGVGRVIVGDVKRYSFKHDAVRNESIFSIPQHTSGNYFITDTFKQRLETSGLTHEFSIVLVGDSENDNFLDERYEPEQREFFEDYYTAALSNPYGKPPAIIRDLDLQEKGSYANINQRWLQIYEANEKIKPVLFDSPDYIIHRTQEYLRKITSELSKEEKQQMAFEVAIFWGEQVIDMLEWQWQVLNGRLAIVAPDNTMYVDVIKFIRPFFTNKDVVWEGFANMFRNLSHQPMFQVRKDWYVELEYNGFLAHPVEKAALPAKRLSSNDTPNHIEPFPESLRKEQTEIIAATLHLYQQQTQSDDLSPPAVIMWLQGYVEALRESGIAGDELRNIGVDMATLWGEQIVQHYGWTWHILDDEYAVVAPDASLYILPIPFMAQFFVDREKDITVALVFNGLSRTDIVRAKAGAYVELR